MLRGWSEGFPLCPGVELGGFPLLRVWAGKCAVELCVVREAPRLLLLIPQLVRGVLF